MKTSKTLVIVGKRPISVPLEPSFIEIGEAQPITMPPLSKSEEIKRVKYTAAIMATDEYAHWRHAGRNHEDSFKHAKTFYKVKQIPGKPYYDWDNLPNNLKKITPRILGNQTKLRKLAEQQLKRENQAVNKPKKYWK